MTLQVERRDHDHTSVELRIEIPAERVTQAIERETQRALKRVQVPGFRAGKAPRPLAERYLDTDRVRRAGVEQAVRSACAQAIEEQGLAPYEVTTDFDPESYQPGQPLTVTATVELPPHVHLGEYRDLTGELIVPEVTDESVEQEIDRYREMLARWTATDEPAAAGDRVRVTVEVLPEGDAEPYRLLDNQFWTIGRGLPDLEAGMIGLAAGETREHTFTFPEDFSDERFRGKTVTCQIAVHQVLRRQLPDAEQLARDLDRPDAETLRREIRTRQEAEAQALAHRELRESLLRQLVGNSDVHLPESLVAREVAERTAALVRDLEAAGRTLEQFLAENRITLAQLQERLAGDIRRGLAELLVVYELARAEQIEVTDTEIEQYLRQRAEEERQHEPRVLRRLLHDDSERQRARRRLLSEKVLERLESLAKIETKTA